MKIVRIKLAEIKGSVYQPRSQTDLQIGALADSIVANGLIVPLIVCASGTETFKILCGSRRYEALTIIQDSRMPLALPEGAAAVDKDGKIDVQVIVVPSSISRKDAAIHAFVENIERLDLSPIERARCYLYMIKTLHMTQQEIEERTGVDQTTISKLIQLLDLPREIQNAIDERIISYKHALIILRLPDRERRMSLFKKIVEENLKLPDTEFWCARLLGDEEIPPEEKQFDDFEERLMKNDTLNTWIDNKKLRMIRSRQGERIMFNVSSVDEFLDIMKTIQGAIVKKRR